MHWSIKAVLMLLSPEHIYHSKEVLPKHRNYPTGWLTLGHGFPVLTPETREQSRRGGAWCTQMAVIINQRSKATESMLKNTTDTQNKGEKGRKAHFFLFKRKAKKELEVMPSSRCTKIRKPQTDTEAQ